MHSLKNSVVAVGLLALAFMFYQSSSPQPQGDSEEQQASLALQNSPLPNSPNTTESEPEIVFPEDPFFTPKHQSQPPKKLPPPKLPAQISPSNLGQPLPSKPESLNFAPTSPLTDNEKQKNLADALRNQPTTPVLPKALPLSPSPPNGSPVPNAEQSLDSSFNARAGVITPTVPRKLSSKEVADLWTQVNLDAEQNNLKNALRTLSNYHASNELNGPQYQKTMAWLDGLAAKVIWSQEPHLEKSDPTAVEIPLAKLAGQWKVSVPLIQKINGLPPSKTSAIPSTLKVIKGPFDLKVDRDEDKMTLYLGELYGCQFDFAGSNLSPGKYHVNINSENILLKATDGRELVIRGELTTSEVAPQSGIISLTNSQLKEVCELLTRDSTVTIR